jgi:hypothetical protein
LAEFGLFREEYVITRVSNAAAAGATTVNSSSIDLATNRTDAIAFLVCGGALVGDDYTVQIQGSSDDSTFVDIGGTLVVDTDNHDAIVEVVNPGYRYVRAEVARGGAGVVLNGVYAIETRVNAKTPATQPTGTNTLDVVNP